MEAITIPANQKWSRPFSVLQRLRWFCLETCCSPRMSHTLKRCGRCLRIYPTALGVCCFFILKGMGTTHSCLFPQDLGISSSEIIPQLCTGPGCRHVLTLDKAHQGLLEALKFSESSSNPRACACHDLQRSLPELS